MVEDDQGVRESLAMVLEFQGLEVVQAKTGEAALVSVAELDPDAILLDINLPGIDGLELCRRLRARGDNRPVLMLTARHEVGDRVVGLDAGADDYLAKPFALEELLARVRALLRRTATVTEVPSQQKLDDLVLDTASRRVTRAGNEIVLTKIEFDLLELLITNSDIVLTRDTIYSRIWGYEEDLASNTLEVFVSSLRKKITTDGAKPLIHTIRGVGYVARAR